MKTGKIIIGLQTAILIGLLTIGGGVAAYRNTGMPGPTNTLKAALGLEIDRNPDTYKTLQAKLQLQAAVRERLKALQEGRVPEGVTALPKEVEGQKAYTATIEGTSLLLLPTAQVTELKGIEAAVNFANAQVAVITNPEAITKASPAGFEIIRIGELSFEVEKRGLLPSLGKRGINAAVKELTRVIEVEADLRRDLDLRRPSFGKSDMVKYAIVELPVPEEKTVTIDMPEVSDEQASWAHSVPTDRYGTHKAYIARVTDERSQVQRVVLARVDAHDRVRVDPITTFLNVSKTKEFLLARAPQEGIFWRGYMGKLRQQAQHAPAIAIPVTTAAKPSPAGVITLGGIDYELTPGKTITAGAIQIALAEGEVLERIVRENERLEEEIENLASSIVKYPRLHAIVAVEAPPVYPFSHILPKTVIELPKIGETRVIFVVAEDQKRSKFGLMIRIQTEGPAVFTPDIVVGMSVPAMLDYIEGLPGAAAEIERPLLESYLTSLEVPSVVELTPPVTDLPAKPSPAGQVVEIGSIFDNSITARLTGEDLLVTERGTKFGEALDDLTRRLSEISLPKLGTARGVLTPIEDGELEDIIAEYSDVFPASVIELARRQGSKMARYLILYNRTEIEEGDLPSRDAAVITVKEDGTVSVIPIDRYFSVSSKGAPRDAIGYMTSLISNGLMEIATKKMWIEHLSALKGSLAGGPVSMPTKPSPAGATFTDIWKRVTADTAIPSLSPEYELRMSKLAEALDTTASDLISAQPDALDETLLRAIIDAYAVTVTQMGALIQESPDTIGVAVAGPLKTVEASRDLIVGSQKIGTEVAKIGEITGTIIIDESEIPENQSILKTLLDKNSPHLKALEAKLGARVRLLGQFSHEEDIAANMIAISSRKIDGIEGLRYLDIRAKTDTAFLPLEYAIVMAKGLLQYNKETAAQLKPTLSEMYRLLASQPLKDEILQTFLSTGRFYLDLPVPKPIDESYYETLHRQVLAALIAA